ncbi:hypothetical protein ABZ780_31800 [Micromonospora sp. NPDC047467]|uniref:hypothetical protein n=1 Tax=Micromonospora sp. NPDC047467 TaxID=3154814 RepID=UPI0033CD2041
MAVDVQGDSGPVLGNRREDLLVAGLVALAVRLLRRQQLRGRQLEHRGRGRRGQLLIPPLLQQPRPGTPGGAPLLLLDGLRLPQALLPLLVQLLGAGGEFGVAAGAGCLGLPVDGAGLAVGAGLPDDAGLAVRAAAAVPDESGTEEPAADVTDRGRGGVAAGEPVDEPLLAAAGRVELGADLAGDPAQQVRADRRELVTYRLEDAPDPGGELQGGAE